ncbi:hypothetical protein [Gemmobacter sp. 24YEA27]|uniref:hypothetical protein n=1 Tax=Gemmobacter sp. 24YEA27 TaxID=3040672 RepID=UPI0024B34D7F|nr:hypothetical protein [Gemmobacter sp. 24YEA27]
MFRQALAGLTMALFLNTGAAMAEMAQDYLGIPGPITLGGAEYGLAWSSQPTPHYTKQEYLPAGQQPGAQTSMVMLEFLAGGISPADAVAQKVTELNARKASDPVTNYSILEHKDGQELILDFVISGHTEAGEMILEWNGYRYFTAEDDQGQHGVFLFAISHRAYGEADARRFLEGLSAFRNQQIDALARAAKPDFGS